MMSKFKAIHAETIVFVLSCNIFFIPRHLFVANILVFHIVTVNEICEALLFKSEDIFNI